MRKQSATLSRDTTDAIRDAKHYLAKDLARLPANADLERQMIVQALDILNNIDAGWRVE